MLSLGYKGLKQISKLKVPNQTKIQSELTSQTFIMLKPQFQAFSLVWFDFWLVLSQFLQSMYQWDFEL